MTDQPPADFDQRHPPAEQAGDHAAMSMNLPAPERVGQATAIEQSRAVAEVQAAVVMARNFPRDTQKAIAGMRESCGMARLAERAFFRFPRGGETVSGESVHLARELARCWGNIDYGVKELRRDDQFAQSEMLAFAWDLETNARSEIVFIVPHMRDRKGGPKRLVDLRDIYENNANMGARRLRECIFSVLPPWYKEEAKELCHKTLEHGGGKPLTQRIADSLAAFGEIGIDQKMLEAKHGRSVDRWTAQDIAQLGVIYKSLQRGEVTVEDEFGDTGNRATAAEIKGEAAPTAQPTAAAPAPSPTQPEQPATPADPSAGATGDGGGEPNGPVSNDGEAAAEPAQSGDGPDRPSVEYEAMLNAGKMKAGEGMAALQAWWEGLSPAQQHALDGERATLKAEADAVDKMMAEQREQGAIDFDAPAGERAAE